MDHRQPPGELRRRAQLDPAFPGAEVTVWRAQTCERGLLHPVEQLDVTFVPRLADLGMTAMRRDATGKAAGHPTVAGPGVRASC